MTTSGVLKSMKPAGAVDLVEVRRAQLGEDHRLAAHLAPPGDQAELGALGAQLLRAGLGLVGRGRQPAVGLLEHLDRFAAAAEAVVRGVAELERERVDDVLTGGGRAPRVVAPAAELDVEVDADERGALGVDPRPVRGRGRVHALLHQDLRVEVADLRPGDHQRVAALAFGAAHQQGVRGAHRRAGEEGAGRARGVELQRALVGASDARGPLGRHLVGEALLEDGHGRLGVLGGAEVLEGACPVALAEAALQGIGEQRELQLLATALAEDPADHRGRGDDVRGLEELGAERAADRDVLARHLGRVELGLEDVLVDARQVVLGVGDDPRALGDRGTSGGRRPDARGRPRCRARRPTVPRPGPGWRRPRSSRARRGPRGAGRP